MSLVATYTYEEGVNGAAIPNNVNGVIAVSGNPTYQSAGAMHGSMGALSPSTANGGTLTYATPNNAAASGSIYAKVTTADSSGPTRLLTFRNGGTALAFVGMQPAGGFNIQDSDGKNIKTTQLAKWRLNQWFRLDWQRTWDGTTLSVTVKLFTSNPEHISPDTTFSVSLPSAAPNRVRVGDPSAGWNTYFDTVRLYNDVSVWPAPVNPRILAYQAHSWVGDPAGDGFVVASKVVNATSVRLVVSSSLDMSSPTYVAAQTPDEYGYVRHIVNGLLPDSSYYYQLADTPSGGSESLFGSVGKGRTTPAAGATTMTLKMALGSCQMNHGFSTTSAAWDDLLSWQPHAILHLGDFHYNGANMTPNQDIHVATYQEQIAGLPVMKQVLANIPLIYTISDHETSGDDGDNAYWLDGQRYGTLMPDPTTMANMSVFQRVVPYRQLADTRTPARGRYRSWVVGRVRFILTDFRSTDRSPGMDPDGSQKTALGAVQLDWLKSELMKPELVKVIISDPAWLADPPNPITNGSMDKWWSYRYEQNVIADFINANHINVDFWAGDRHMIAFTNAESNTVGHFPQIVGSPFEMHGLGLQPGETYDGVYGDDIDMTKLCQYMRITITDDGTTITRVASGWDALNATERVTQTVTWSGGRTGKPKVWDGSTWTAHPAKVWNGSAWVPERTKGYDGTNWVDSK